MGWGKRIAIGGAVAAGFYFLFLRKSTPAAAAPKPQLGPAGVGLNDPIPFTGPSGFQGLGPIGGSIDPTQAAKKLTRSTATDATKLTPAQGGGNPLATESGTQNAKMQYGLDQLTGVVDTSLARKGVTTSITGAPDAQGFWNGWGRIKTSSGGFFTVPQIGHAQGQAPSLQDWLNADRGLLRPANG